MSAIRSKKHDLQPETVQVAKRQAERLAELFAERGVPLKRSEALEAVARLHAARDWNTFRAGLASDERATAPKRAPSAEEMRQFLALDKGPDLCARRIITLAGPGADQGGMWRSRASRMLEAILPLLFKRASSQGRGPSPLELREAMTLEGALDLYDWYEREVAKDIKLRMLHISLSIVPGFDFYAWRQTRAFDPKTRDQFRFTCDVWAKLLDDLMSGEVPIPVTPDLARA
jgi:hypothetical protein